jgi:hypothetical protein
MSPSAEFFDRKPGRTLTVESVETSLSNSRNSVQSKSRLSGLRRKGWRPTVLGWVCAALTIFFLNLGFVIWAEVGNSKSPSLKANGSTRVLYDGDCKKTKKFNTIAHIIINTLSSILLCASNYGMQCMSAPTREEVDKAHAESKWLDIGVLSVRNLRSINKKRVLIWGLLGFSSIPLHLLFVSHDSL